MQRRVPENSRAARERVRRVTQFLDLGTGIPTADSTHEVAQSIDPAARIVYVDNEPIVLTHARALLTSTPTGATAYLDADVRDVDRIVEEARATVDFEKPVAVMSLMTMQFVPDNDEAYAVISRAVGVLPSGGYLVLPSRLGTPCRPVSPKLS